MKGSEKPKQDFVKCYDIQELENHTNVILISSSSCSFSSTETEEQLSKALKSDVSGDFSDALLLLAEVRSGDVKSKQ